MNNAGISSVALFEDTVNITDFKQIMVFFFNVILCITKSDAIYYDSAKRIGLLCFSLS